MDKIVIYATGNERLTGDFNVSYYVVEKRKGFLTWLGTLLEEVLEIKDGKIKALNYSKMLDDGGEEYVLKNVAEMKDVHEHYGEGGNRVDLFYGEKRIFVTFRKDRGVRKKFADFLIRHTEWVKVEDKPMVSLGDFQMREKGL